MNYSFYVDPTYNDFRISSNNMVLVRGSDTIAQAIKIALQTEIGSWFLDINYGLPLITATGIVNNNEDNGILGSNYPDSLIQTYFLRVVLSIEGVLSVEEFIINRQKEQKKLIIAMKVVILNSNTNSVGTEYVINVVLGG